MNGATPDEAEGRGPADALYAHYLTFPECHSDARKILVTVQLTNGEFREFEGLRIDRILWAPEWVMIRGDPDEPGEATAVHEGSIYRMEFTADPPESDFGFN